MCFIFLATLGFLNQHLLTPVVQDWLYLVSNSIILVLNSLLLRHAAQKWMYFVSHTILGVLNVLKQARNLSIANFDRSEMTEKQLASKAHFSSFLQLNSFSFTIKLCERAQSYKNFKFEAGKKSQKQQRGFQRQSFTKKLRITLGFM